MGAAQGILGWARGHISDAEANECKLTKFIFPDDFERYMYARMMTDASVSTDEFNVVPTHQSGVTITTLLGIPCRFDRRLPHGKTLFVWEPINEARADGVPAVTPEYPQEAS